LHRGPLAARRLIPPMATPPLCLERGDWLTALGLAALILLTGSCRMAHGVCGVYHDDAIYVSTGQALAMGEGYRQIGVPGAPLQTKYPILYPALLAAVWRVWPKFPDNLLAMKGITLFSGAAAVGLAYLYVVRFGYVRRGAAAGAGLLCGTAPFLVYWCAQTMAEMPFALLSVVALWALDRQLLRPGAPGRVLFSLGVLLALPFLCRAIGATLIVASLWVLFRSGRPL